MKRNEIGRQRDEQILGTPYSVDANIAWIWSHSKAGALNRNSESDNKHEQTPAGDFSARDAKRAGKQIDTRLGSGDRHLARNGGYVESGFVWHESFPLNPFPAKRKLRRILRSKFHDILTEEPIPNIHTSSSRGRSICILPEAKYQIVAPTVLRALLYWRKSVPIENSSPTRKRNQSTVFRMRHVEGSYTFQKNCQSERRWARTECQLQRRIFALAATTTRSHARCLGLERRNLPRLTSCNIE